MLAAKRAEFKAALTAVDGVTGYATRPNLPKTGDAWPVWSGATREDDGIAFTHSWSVVVALPTNEDTAEEWVDVYLESIYDAVQQVGYIDGFVISNLNTESARYALVLTTRSE